MDDRSVTVRHPVRAHARAVTRWRLLVIANALIVANAQTGSPNVVISQIYGGGGNKGATLKNDFIELFNRASLPINVNGWTVQHASATGSLWDRTFLSGIIQPGHYYLIQEFQGTGGTVSLPTPDAVGGIDLSATSDKIALVNNSINLTGTAPGGSGIVDFVGYGTANAAEGQPASGLDNTTALIRLSGGCTASNNNHNDFTTSSPKPRNGGSPANPCSTVIASPSGPQTSQGAVVNGATFGTGPIAPGEIVTIFGSNLGPPQLVTLQLTPDGLRVSNSLAGTRVRFDGVPAPVLYTSDGQVSVVVPFALAGHPTTTLQVEYDAQVSDPLLLPVAASSPGIFTSDASGRGQAAVLNQDYSVNSATRPAARGSVIIVYATGAGQTIPVSEDGRIVGSDVLPAPVQSVSARVAGLNADVLYGGAAPGLVSGVLQVNVRIPDAPDVAGPVPLLISVGTTPSQAGVIVWIAP
jgi:uncharacterized protein (TIGR03437 family)